VQRREAERVLQVQRHAEQEARVRGHDRRHRREAAVSPHHLSRTFRASTGHTIARHRMLLRARLALERLAGGERNPARLAAELGFADQSHLTRVVRALTGRTPAALRAALAAGPSRG
jgi:AraC-like DNA-binding protein